MLQTTVGIERPPAIAAAERAVLHGLAARAGELDEMLAIRTTYAAAGLGEHELVPVLLGMAPWTDPLDPTQTFGFAERGFIRFVAAAIRERAPASVVEAAWQDFVQRFPDKLAAETLRSTDLLSAALAISRLGGPRPFERIRAAVGEARSPSEEVRPVDPAAPELGRAPRGSGRDGLDRAACRHRARAERSPRPAGRARVERRTGVESVAVREVRPIAEGGGAHRALLPSAALAIAMLVLGAIGIAILIALRS